MDRVLLDGTTLMFSARLLAGEDRPSAMHVYALGLLVESAILHEHVIVLDTAADHRILESAEAYGAGALTVERRTPRDVVTEYVEREFPDLDGLRSLEGDELHRLSVGGGERKQRDAIARAQRHLSDVLERGYHDDAEMQGYLKRLEIIHGDQLAAVPVSRPSRVARLLPRNWFSGSEWHLPIEDGTALGGITSEAPIRNAWEDFMRRYTNVGGQSPWNYNQTLAGNRRQQFLPSLLIRAHFYVLASEVLEAPYRPDGFRAPICWKFFREGSFAELGMDEAFVQAAERAQLEEVESVNRFLQRRSFVGLPFFLARVLGESRSAADVVGITREIRESREARRFREYAARLRREEEAGNVREIAREVQAVAAALRKEFAPSARSFDVLWTLAGAGGKAAIAQDPGSLLDLGVKSGSAATKGAVGVGAWWRNRKLALISKTVKQARRAKDMQGELKRLFSASLSDGEIDVLRHLDRLGRPSGRM